MSSRHRARSSTATRRGGSGAARRTAPRQEPPAGELLLAGDTRRARYVADRLRSLAIDVYRVHWGDELFDALRKKPLAVVLVEPLVGHSTSRAVKEMVQASAAQVVVVLPDNASAARVRALYAAGATAVFAWPRDALILSEVLAEALAIGMVRGKPRKADTALARTVRAHVVASRAQVRKLDVTAADGIVELSGTVDGLWQKHELEEIVARVPGVRSIDAARVRIPSSSIPDRRLRASILSLMRDTTDLDAATITVAVHRGYVKLAGTAADRQELRRLTDIVAQMHGVRGIEDHVVVSSAQRRRDTSLVRRLRTYLADLFPRNEVDVTAFGKIVVLDGRVETLSARKSIAAFVADDPTVERVINKLRVDG